MVHVPNAHTCGQNCKYALRHLRTVHVPHHEPKFVGFLCEHEGMPARHVVMFVVCSPLGKLFYCAPSVKVCKWCSVDHRVHMCTGFYINIIDLIVD